MVRDRGGAVGSLGTFFKTFLILSALTLASASFTLAGQATVRGVTVYADNLLSTNCTSGNYSIANRNCTGRDGNGYRSLQSAVNTSTGGDTIFVRGSATRYTGDAESGAVTASGSSDSNRLTVEGYQDENPTVKGFYDIKYVNVRNLTVDMNNEINTVGIAWVSFSTVENVEIKNAGQHGMVGLESSEFIDLNLHDNGWNTSFDVCPPKGPSHGQCHGVYTGGDPAYSNNLFDGGRYHHNSGYGIHCYSNCGNTTIRNLRADHNGNGGIIVRAQSGIEVYNVIVDHNGQSGLVLTANNPLAYNITAVNNRAADIQVGDVDLPLATLRNSIALPNGIGATARATLSNNITTGSVASYFVDAANGDFRLISTSETNNIGADLSAVYY